MSIQELIQLYQISMMLNVILVCFMFFILLLAKPVLPYIKARLTRRPVVAVWHHDNEVRFEVAKVEDETYNTKRYGWKVRPDAVGRLGGVKFGIGLPELAELIPPKLAKKASLLKRLGIRKVAEVTIEEGKPAIRALDGKSLESVVDTAFNGGNPEISNEVKSLLNPRDLVDFVIRGVSAREFRVRIESAKLDVKLEKLKTMDLLKAAIAALIIIAGITMAYLLISKGAVSQAVSAVQNVGENVGGTVNKITNPPINIK